MSTEKRVFRGEDVQKGEAVKEPRLRFGDIAVSSLIQLSAIAHRVGKSIRTVKRHLALMKSHGLLRVEPRGRAGAFVEVGRGPLGDAELDVCQRLGCLATLMAVRDEVLGTRSAAAAMLVESVNRGQNGDRLGPRLVWIGEETGTRVKSIGDKTGTNRGHDVPVLSGSGKPLGAPAGAKNVNAFSGGAVSKVLTHQEVASSTVRYLLGLLDWLYECGYSMTVRIGAKTVPNRGQNGDKTGTNRGQNGDTAVFSPPPSLEGGGDKEGGDGVSSSSLFLSSESFFSSCSERYGNTSTVPVTLYVDSVSEGREFSPFPSPISPPLPSGVPEESVRESQDSGGEGRFTRTHARARARTRAHAYAGGRAGEGCAGSACGAGQAAAVDPGRSQECLSVAQNWPITGRNGNGRGDHRGDASERAKAKSGPSEGALAAVSEEPCGPVEGAAASGAGAVRSQERPLLAQNWPITGRSGQGRGDHRVGHSGRFKAKSGASDGHSGSGSGSGSGVEGPDVVGVLMRVKAPSVKRPTTVRQKDELRRLFVAAGGWGRWSEEELVAAAERYAEWARGSRKRVDWNLFLRRGPGSWGESNGEASGRSARQTSLQASSPVIQSEAKKREDPIKRHLETQVMKLRIRIRAEEERWREYNEYLAEIKCDPRPKPRTLIELEKKLRETLEELEQMFGVTEAELEV